jgi:hypothetical protein
LAKPGEGRLLKFATLHDRNERIFCLVGWLVTIAASMRVSYCRYE